MVKIGYRFEEERYQPSFLLQSAVEAERVRFDFVSVADHFHPWFHQNGSGGQAWVLIGAAAARTNNVVFGTSITAPIYRYHPAIIAQTFATLGEMFPGRIYLGVGTGEAMNEVPLGFEWPAFKERFQRLKEALTIIKNLWTNDFVNFDGTYFKLRDANLYTRPRTPVPLYIAASGPIVARLAGRMGDGLICGVETRPDFAQAKEVLAQFCQAAKEAGREVSALHKLVGINVSYDPDYDKALHSLERWRILASDEPGSSAFLGKNIYDPRVMDQIGANADMSKLVDRWIVCTNLEDVLKEIEKIADSEFNEVEIASVSPNERAFLAEFGSKTLPYLHEAYPAGALRKSAGFTESRSHHQP